MVAEVEREHQLNPASMRPSPVNAHPIHGNGTRRNATTNVQGREAVRHPPLDGMCAARRRCKRWQLRCQDVVVEIVTGEPAAATRTGNPQNACRGSHEPPQLASHREPCRGSPRAHWKHHAACRRDYVGERVLEGLTGICKDGSWTLLASFPSEFG